MLARAARLGAALCCSAGLLSAQKIGDLPRPLTQMHHTTWGELDGLPPGTMNRMLRTPDGYLWLGGDGPLVRFDGVRFTTVDPVQVPALASTVPGGLRPLLIDRSGTLWIGRADGGLVQYRDGRYQVAARGRGRGWDVHHLAEDRRGRIWAMLTSPHGLYFVDGDSLRAATLPPWLPPAELIGLIPDTLDGLWMGWQAHGIIHLTPLGVRHVPVPSTIGGVNARPLLQSRDGALYVFGDGLQVLRGDTWRTIVAPNGGARLLTPKATEGTDGAIWVASRGHGVLRVVNGRVDQFAKRDGLSDEVVSAVIPDDEGSVWIVTDAGLDRLRRSPFAPLAAAQGLPFDAPNWIAADAGGALWVLSYTGLSMHLIDGGIVRGRRGPVSARALENPSRSRYVPLYPARVGGLWVRDPATGRIARALPDRLVPLAISGLAGREPALLIEDEHGTLWLSIQGGGLGRVIAGRWHPISVAPELGSSTVTEIVQDAIGRIVVAAPTRPMLFFFDGDSLVRRLGPADGIRLPLSDLVPDGIDTLWADDRDSSLLRIIGDRVDRVSSSALGPLLRSGSVELVPAGDHFLIASTAGIVSVARADLHAAADSGTSFPRIHRFSSLDGLPTSRLTSRNAQAAARLEDGRIWFSTPGGLVVYDPRERTSNHMAPHVHIEGVRAAGRVFAADSLVTIPAGATQVELRFTATALRVPEQVRIEFRLDGVDREWRLADATRQVTYTQLRPRRYAFRVRAWNEDGVPASSEAMVQLRILPVWSESWWFLAVVWLAAAALVAASLTLAFRARARREADRLSARFDAALDERTRLAGELHDTLLQGFTGVTLQLQAVRGSLHGHNPAADEELGRVLGIADMTLRDARMMVWDMRAPELDGQDLVAALERATAVAIGAAPLTFAVEVRGVRRRLSPAVETTALRVGREAVINAVRHAGATHIWITIDFEPRALHLAVRDDGAGFDVERARPTAGEGHWGLIGMQERAQRAGGNLSVVSGRGAGTVLELVVPIGAG